MPKPVERYDPEGIDYGWIMQVTFVLTILIGAPVVAIASTWVTLPSWGERVQFAVAVGAVVWFVTGVVVFAYERSRNA